MAALFQNGFESETQLTGSGDTQDTINTGYSGMTVFTDFFENNPLPMCIHDKDSLRFIGVNEAALKKCGYTREEFLEMTVNDIHPAEELGEIDASLRWAANGPKLHRYRLKSGEVIAVKTTSHELDYKGHRAVLTVIPELTDLIRIKRPIEEKECRSLIEAMPIGYYRSTAEGSFLEANPAFAEILGYSREELLSTKITEELSFNAGEPEVEEISRGFPSKPEMYQLRRKDGSLIWLEDFRRYVHNHESRVAYREGIVRQITDREVAEHKSLESEGRYWSFVDQLPVAIAVYTDWKLVYANPALLKLSLADSVGQLLGRSMLEFVDAEFRQVMLDHVSAVLSGTKAIQASALRFIRLDGSTTFVRVSSASLSYSGKPSVQSAFQDISEHGQIEEKLRLQSAALDAVADAIVITDQTGRAKWVNRAFEKLTGFSALQAVGTDIGKLVRSGKQDRPFYKDMWDTIMTGKVWHGQLVNRRKDGTLYNEDMKITPVLDIEGEITHFIAVKEDITERKSLEDEHMQAQKLDLIGRLAGGLAHDYNNVLGVILGYGELIKSKLRDQESIRGQLDAIIAAARRGAELTRRLLSFERREVISPKVISINSAIESIKEMLQQIIGENRELVVNLEKDLWNVKVDPTQLDQILVNLATNARDAIKDVGTITINTSNLLASEAFVRDHVGFVQGEYVRISFADTGEGINQDTVKKIFEPFFTTKPAGQGTGLGLAVVYAIIRQNSGSIEVESEPGIGTKFQIYFPRFHGEPEKTNEQFLDGMPRGSATVLVVEDRADLLELTKRGLEQCGYEVLTALNPQEALSICGEFPGDVGLLLADVIMPGMNGRELSHRIGIIKPKIRTLFMSGYTEDVLAPQDLLGKGIEFIQKPFTPQALAKKIQEVLGGT